MRVLLGFAIVCVLLLGWAAWHLQRVRAPAPALAPAPSPPLAPTDPAPAPADVHAAAASAAPVDVLAPSDPPEPAAAPATGLVHWALPPGYDAALRTVALSQEILRTEPHHVDALRDQAGALLVLHRWPEASTVLVRYLALQPDDAALRYELAAALMRQQRWSEALANWRTLVEQTPEDHRCWFNLAVARQALGHLADARRAWDEVLRRVPSPAAYARRGEVLLDLEEWAAAAADFERVLDAQPEAEDALLNLCLALRRCGEARAAADRLRTFIALHPRHVPALNALAETAWELGTADAAGSATWRAEAERCWTASLALDESQDAIRARLAAARGAP